MKTSMKILTVIAVTVVLVSVSVFTYYYVSPSGDDTDERFTALEAKAIADELILTRLSQPILISVHSDKSIDRKSVV